ncbi:hypothetical protein NI17_003055 [Thermobifida halotolerans]|uniref:Sel1 repeat family protein n=1 Tax=Thermobifida halotolerans TaxID=483545 RepID=A0AA97LY55_9ACTN|nr:hypothetical protein [Thermobifida halotolerans]UOE20239.1 hypothetical protein NI17_003055 [Thermobifida halotolerans]
MHALWQTQQDLPTGEGGHPRAFRVVAAAVDLARIGVEHADRNLLEAAHRLYALPAVLRPEPFDRALVWAVREHEDTCGLLLPVTTDDRQEAWRPFDYLVDQTTTPLPDGLWNLALNHTTSPDTHFAIGWAAYDHNRSAIAETTFRQAADTGNTTAMVILGILLAERDRPTKPRPGGAAPSTRAIPMPCTTSSYSNGARPKQATLTL